MLKETSARVEAVYQHKKIDWERRNKRLVDAKVSWELHEEARTEVAEKQRTRRKRTGAEDKEENDSIGRRSKRRTTDFRHPPPGSRFKCATLGDGVEIKRTTLPGASVKNKGLFVTRMFLENELITEYTGPRITRKEALELRAQGKASHVKGINYDFCIDGDQNPIPGQGIAQFANDATRDGNNNSKFELKFDQDNGETRCFIKALKKLNPGDEVFVGYGNAYWVMDPVTGGRIYDENAHEAFVARCETRQKLEDEYQREREARLRKKREEAKAKREQALKLQVEREAQRQEETKKRALERARAKEEERIARKEQKKMEVQRAKAAEKQQREQAQAEQNAEREARAFAEALRQDQIRLEARKRAQEAVRLKRKKEEEEMRRKEKEFQAKAVAQKLRMRTRIEQLYEEAKLKWEKKNGKAISSSVAWDLYEAARDKVDQEEGDLQDK